MKTKRKCSVENCNRLYLCKGYCNFHYKRDKSGIPLNVGLHETFRGERNPRWNGGVSEYPNHSLMKKVRLEVLKEANYICQICGDKATEIHHKDLSKDNHLKENLIPVCHKCQRKFLKSYTSKYKRLYGHTHKELTAMGFFKKNKNLFNVSERLKIGL